MTGGMTTRAAGGRAMPAALLALELLTGISALYGGIMLVTDAWRLPEDYLSRLPFSGWVVPGIALIVMVAVPMLVAAGLVMLRRPWRRDASLAAGVLLVGWILVQLMAIGPRMFLQAVMAGVGLMVALLAWLWHPSRGVHRS